MILIFVYYARSNGEIYSIRKLIEKYNKREDYKFTEDFYNDIEEIKKELLKQYLDQDYFEENYEQDFEEYFESKYWIIDI